MKFLDTIFFSLSVVFLLIGIHQAMMHGFTQSYWLIMISAIFLMILQVRRKKTDKEGQQVQGAENKGKVKSKK